MEHSAQQVPGIREAYVLGHPISHSLSPALHRAAYTVMDVPISYDSLDTLPEQLPEVFARANNGRRICGLSVTMPLKTAIMDYCTVLSNTARITGAVNTVYWRCEGEEVQVCGHNTDVGGIMNALLHAGLNNTAIATGKAAILGGGATAVSALTALHQLGYGTVTVYARSLHKLGSVQRVAEQLGTHYEARSLENFAHTAKTYSTVISTLPAHTADSFAPALHPAPEAVLLDVAYSPWPSQLAAAWEEGGGVVVSGLEMLLYQGLDQVRIFSGYGTAHTTVRLPRELDVLNAMCLSIGLEERNNIPKIFV